MNILPVIAQSVDELTAVFKDLHAHPEIGFEEHRTSSVVAGKLKDYGVDEIHTGIGGSSMGGLISLYAGMMYPEVYSKWMIFSPSLWVAPDLPLDASDMYTDFNRRVYLYAGDQESAHLIERVEQLRNTLQDNHGPGVVADLTLSIRPGGIHNEHHWGMEFPKAVEWLFFQS